MFEGFDTLRIATDGAEIHLVTKGSGPPLLLLHGYPETHVMWHKIAPTLADRYTVVAPDLRGYGDSSKPLAGEGNIGYSKRTMAADMVQVMRQLGHEQWFVVGHDRGARVAYRMALDHADHVLRLCVMDIVPTIEQYEQVKHRAIATAMYHWFFLAQPSPFPEKLIGSDPAYYLVHSIESWAGSIDAFDDDVLAEYIRCFSNPDTIRATCECYRAGATIDCTIDEESRSAGDKIGCPTLVIWGERDGLWDGERQMQTWSRWALDVKGQGVPNGHFCPEEAPTETLAALLEFLGEEG